jgi:hypothetical protein
MMRGRPGRRYTEAEENLRKLEFIEAYPLHSCKLVETCNAIHLDRKLVLRWVQEDEDFRDWLEAEYCRRTEELERMVETRATDPSEKQSLWALTMLVKSRRGSVYSPPPRVPPPLVDPRNFTVEYVDTPLPPGRDWPDPRASEDSGRQH